MSLGPTLETERLILRPPEAADFAPWCAMHADADVMRYLGGVQGPEVTWRGLCTLTGAWTIEGFSMFSIIEKATGEWIGRLGPWRPKGWPGTEVGWALVRAAWGKGYAAEGATAAMDYAFKTLGWTEVIHNILPGNTASVRVAERLGSRFLRTAETPPPLEGMVWDVYGQTAEDWQARQSADRI